MSCSHTIPSCAGSKRHRGERRPLAHRFGAGLSLLALLLTLVLPVMHAWDIPAEIALFTERSGATLLPHQTHSQPMLSATTTTASQALHDPFLCPVCQLLTQTRHSLTPQHTVLISPPRYVTRIVDRQSEVHEPEFVVAASRAPPFLV
jgi:hypothetical protein